MMTSERDYLRRLDVTDPPDPSARSLALLHERHQLAVPFENLDVVSRRPVAFDETTFVDKIVDRRRGGFCYELNGAFSWLLERLGFAVTRHEARVPRRDGGEPIRFDHLVLCVECEGPWLVDVGFGDGYPLPLRLDCGDDETTLHGQRYRVREEGEGRVVERYERQVLAWRELYSFTQEPRQLAEFEEGFRFHRTSPNSPFTTSGLCSILIPDGRVTLTEDRLIVRRGVRREETEVAGEDAWWAAARRYFRISREG